MTGGLGIGIQVCCFEFLHFHGGSWALVTRRGRRRSDSKPLQLTGEPEFPQTMDPEEEGVGLIEFLYAAALANPSLPSVHSLSTSSASSASAALRPPPPKAPAPRRLLVPCATGPSGSSRRRKPSGGRNWRRLRAPRGSVGPRGADRWTERWKGRWNREVPGVWKVRQSCLQGLMSCLEVPKVSAPV